MFPTHGSPLTVTVVRAPCVSVVAPCPAMAGHDHDNRRLSYLGRHAGTGDGMWGSVPVPPSVPYGRRNEGGGGGGGGGGGAPPRPPPPGPPPPPSLPSPFQARNPWTLADVCPPPSSLQAWALHHLAANPDKQAAAVAEVNAVLRQGLPDTAPVVIPTPADLSHRLCVEMPPSLPPPRSCC